MPSSVDFVASAPYVPHVEFVNCVKGMPCEVTLASPYCANHVFFVSLAKLFIFDATATSDPLRSKNNHPSSRTRRAPEGTLRPAVSRLLSPNSHATWPLQGGGAPEGAPCARGWGGVRPSFDMKVGNERSGARGGRDSLHGLPGLGTTKLTTKLTFLKDLHVFALFLQWPGTTGRGAPERRHACSRPPLVHSGLSFQYLSRTCCTLRSSNPSLSPIFERWANLPPLTSPGGAGGGGAP